MLRARAVVPRATQTLRTFSTLGPRSTPLPTLPSSCQTPRVVIIPLSTPYSRRWASTVLPGGVLRRTKSGTPIAELRVPDNVAFRLQTRRPRGGWLHTGLTLMILMLFASQAYALVQHSLPGQSKYQVAYHQLQVTADDVQGCDEAKEEVMEIADFFRNPSKYSAVNAEVPRGLLLVGPPGTGKTMLAKALAAEAGCHFFSVSGSEVDGMFVGSGSSLIRGLFSSARKAIASNKDGEVNGAVIFIDEIDSFGGKRVASPTQSGVYRQSLNQLLTEMDGFQSTDRVVVLAATNRKEMLDPALLRPGRFDKEVNVDAPDAKGREAIVQTYLRKVPNGLKQSEITALAKTTPGMTGSDLSNIVNLAAVRAAQVDADVILGEHIEFAKDRVTLGAGKTSRLIPEAGRKLTAYHEGGHALVAMLTEGANQVWKASILPRGPTGGATHFLPSKDQNELSTKKELYANLCVSMGGRAAEELMWGQDGITAGASGDFSQATQLAEAMVAHWGLSPFGKRVVTDAPISEGTKQAMDQAVDALLKNAYDQALQALKKNKDALDKIAAELLEHETVTGERLREVAGL